MKDGWDVWREFYGATSWKDSLGKILEINTPIKHNYRLLPVWFACKVLVLAKKLENYLNFSVRLKSDWHGNYLPPEWALINIIRSFGGSRRTFFDLLRHRTCPTSLKMEMTSKGKYYRFFRAQLAALFTYLKAHFMSTTKVTVLQLTSIPSSSPTKSKPLLSTTASIT